MPRLGKKKIEAKSMAIRAYILATPAATVKQISEANAVSMTWAHRIRRQMQMEGTIPLIRVRRPKVLPPPPPDFSPGTHAPEGAIPKKIGGMLDGAALRFMASDAVPASELADEAATRDALLLQVQRLALDPSLPADLRLSATQVWVKVKDIARAKDLGPGKPLTPEDAVIRLVRLLRAVGPKIALQAFENVFGKEPTNEKTPTESAPSPEGAS